jgi:hypothetical protein
VVAAHFVVVDGVEADAETRREVRLLAKDGCGAAVTVQVAVEPGKADAVALVADDRDTEVEIDRRGGRVDPRRRVGEPDAIDAGDAAVQQPQKLPVGPPATTTGGLLAEPAVS